MQLPAVGTVCAYTFISEFASLSGIYTLETIQTFENAVATNVDFVNSLYVPAGLTATDYTNQWTNYQADNVLELVSVTTPAVTIYVPASIISLMPDPTVQQYNNLAIGILLGTFSISGDDATKLQWLIAEINQIVQSVTGTSNAAEMFTASSTWMTKAAYDTLNQTRQTNINAVMTAYAALQQQLTINNSLKTKIAYYENTFKKLSFAQATSPPPPAS